jgi:hypothetical protein
MRRCGGVRLATGCFGGRRRPSEGPAVGRGEGGGEAHIDCRGKARRGDAHQEGSGGGVADWWWGKFQIQAAPANLVDEVSTRSTTARACTRWAAGWRMGGSRAACQLQAPWGSNNGGQGTHTKEEGKERPTGAPWSLMAGVIGVWLKAAGAQMLTRRHVRQSASSSWSRRQQATDAKVPCERLVSKRRARVRVPVGEGEVT